MGFVKNYTNKKLFKDIRVTYNYWYNLILARDVKIPH